MPGNKVKATRVGKRKMRLAIGLAKRRVRNVRRTRTNLINSFVSDPCAVNPEICCADNADRTVDVGPCKTLGSCRTTLGCHIEGFKMEDDVEILTVKCRLH
jgi:hypothetical protein